MTDTATTVLDQAFGENWAMYNGDCIQTLPGLPANSVDFSIYSPPFNETYVYSDSEADLGNSRDSVEFFQHFDFLARELLRVMKPGRIVAVHCKDLPTYKNRHGASGLYDFPGDIIRSFEATKQAPDAAANGYFQFHSRVTIWKDPVIEAQRTNNHGLLFRNFSDRAEVVRQGMADYMLMFRKWAPEMPEKQVKQNRTPGDYIGTSPPPTSIDNDRDYGIAVWQRYASPVWFDIDQTDVLNYQIAREDEDEKHLCPLQLGVIRRCIDLWTNPGDLVLSPFAGVGSEGVVAIEQGRRFVGIELKRSYWSFAQRYLADAEFTTAQPTMFDLFDAEMNAAPAPVTRFHEAFVDRLLATSLRDVIDGDTYDRIDDILDRALLGLPADRFPPITSGPTYHGIDAFLLTIGTLVNVHTYRKIEALLRTAQVAA